MVFPYMKGLVIIKCGFFYIALWIYCVFSICGDSICISIVYSIFVLIVFIYLFRLLTSGIRSLSLVDIVGKYFLFLHIF